MTVKDPKSEDVKLPADFQGRDVVLFFTNKDFQSALTERQRIYEPVFRNIGTTQPPSREFSVRRAKLNQIDLTKASTSMHMSKGSPGGAASSPSGGDPQRSTTSTGAAKGPASAAALQRAVLKADPALAELFLQLVGTEKLLTEDEFWATRKVHYF